MLNDFYKSSIDVDTVDSVDDEEVDDEAVIWWSVVDEAVDSFSVTLLAGSLYKCF